MPTVFNSEIKNILLKTHVRTCSHPTPSPLRQFFDKKPVNSRSGDGGGTERVR